MGVDIRRMAKIAGVSVATISRATNPDERHKVAPETLKKIDALISEHGYTPHLAARHLSRKKTKMIGVIFPYTFNIFYSSYYTHILAGVANFLLKSDYQFKLILLHERKEMWDNYDLRIGEGVEGVIITHWFEFFSPKMISEMSIPCVVINDFDESAKARFICENGLEGGKVAAKHLYEIGHRDIAIITGPDWSRDSRYRTKGFMDFWQQRGLTIDQNLIVGGHFDDEKKTYDAVDIILKNKKEITAIFCCNDNMAFWAIKRLKQQGFACPQDVSVVGYDDDFRAETFTPALTTVRVPVYDIAREAAKMLKEYLENDGSSATFPKGVEWFPVQLVERSSTRKLT